MHGSAIMQPEDRLKNHIETFKALSDETRLRIVHLLAASKKELCCCEITDSLEEPMYNISRHLKVLKNAGLVEDRKEGRWVYYSLPGKQNAFMKRIFETIASMKGIEKLKTDVNNLGKRFLIRENGKCLLGVQKKHLLRFKGEKK